MLKLTRKPKESDQNAIERIVVYSSHDTILQMALIREIVLFMPMKLRTSYRLEYFDQSRKGYRLAFRVLLDGPPPPIHVHLRVNTNLTFLTYMLIMLNACGGGGDVPC